MIQLSAVCISDKVIRLLAYRRYTVSLANAIAILDFTMGRDWGDYRKNIFYILMHIHTSEWRYIIGNGHINDTHFSLSTPMPSDAGPVNALVFHPFAACLPPTKNYNCKLKTTTTTTTTTTGPGDSCRRWWHLCGCGRVSLFKQTNLRTGQTTTTRAYFLTNLKRLIQSELQQEQQQPPTRLLGIRIRN